MKYKLVIFLCLGLAASACQDPNDIKRKQYFVEGMELYKLHCANCHQLDGKGLGNLYPPLDGSDYLTAANKATIICAMRYGHADTLMVNGKAYAQPMPANDQLKDIDIAEITTYIYNQWGGEKIITETSETSKILDKCLKERP